jgi:transposase
MRRRAGSEGLPDWIGVHVGALAAIGGVPKAVVCDNLKAGVTKASRYEPGVNRTYQDLATHYGFAILPTRVHKPRDKAKVEVAVQIVRRFVLARFFSLGDLNIAIHECVADLNAKIMRKLGKSRRELPETIERPAPQSVAMNLIAMPSGSAPVSPPITTSRLQATPTPPPRPHP